jgi:23S rRNA (adenine2030-N6)-methyltransferase
MNYKHAYHAGNHTEVFKHSVLCLLLLEFLKKPKPFTVLDTHAGAGVYDIHSPEAEKTGEARDGICRIFEHEVPSATVFLNIVRRLNPDRLCYYPGSPAIVQALLREDDRLIACELREDDSKSLRRNLKKDPRVSIHRRDGYEAICAFVPPTTRRGLVFVDPPFEALDEVERLSDRLNSGIKKWPTGMFVAWYPIKNKTGVRKLRTRYLSSNPPTLCCELLREPADGTKLAGSGLIICNPPWQFEKTLKTLCPQLISALEARQGYFNLQWWVREAS